jgi:aminocarboxymuconate-semialdehyde decarboxylase
MTLIDVHAHFVPAPCFSDPTYGFSIAKGGDDQMALMRGGVPLGPADLTIGQLSDPAHRIHDMRATSVDRQALSVDPGLFFYDVPIGRARPRADFLNQELAAVAASYPGHFDALGTVCLQDVPTAIDQLRECVTALKMRGVAICTNVNGRNLSETEYEPFFEAAESLGATVFVHPYNIAAPDRSRCYAARVVVGNPLETTLTLYSLMMSGLFERLPHLRCIFSHGGGALPYLTGRVERGYGVRNEIRDSLEFSPTHSLSRVFVDTVVHDPRVLRFLVEMWGARGVVPGTDYPYDMGDLSPRGVVEEAFGAGSPLAEQILGLNAARALGLSLATADAP